jgi:hypothetical protein
VKRLFLLLLIPALFGCATTSKNSGETTVREFDLTTTPKEYDRAPYRVCPPIFPGFGTYCTP